MTSLATALLERTRIARIVVRAVALAALVGLPASPVGAQKTDVVHLTNGNVITGEVKKLERGLLEFSVDDVTNRLKIKWEHVARLTSTQQLDIEDFSGNIYFGSLIEPSTDGELRVQTGDGTVDVKLVDVVLIEPIEATFWKRLDGDIQAGLSFTKATDLLQFNLGGSVRYRRLVSLTDLSFNSIITSRSGEEDKTNSDIQLTHYRFFRNRWFYRGDGWADRNDELGIDFRGSLGGGVGRRIVQTNQALFLLSGLLSVNREMTSDGEDSNNVEFVVDSSLLAFRHDTPKLDLRSDLAIFLSLTTGGRYRIEYDGRFSFEFVQDLFWDIAQIYYRYDSEPVADAEARSDYGIVTGLRYKF